VQEEDEDELITQSILLLDARRLNAELSYETRFFWTTRAEPFQEYPEKYPKRALKQAIFWIVSV